MAMIAYCCCGRVDTMRENAMRKQIGFGRWRSAATHVGDAGCGRSNQLEQQVMDLANADRAQQAWRRSSGTRRWPRRPSSMRS